MYNGEHIAMNMCRKCGLDKFRHFEIFHTDFDNYNNWLFPTLFSYWNNNEQLHFWMARVQSWNSSAIIFCACALMKTSPWRIAILCCSGADCVLSGGSNSRLRLADDDNFRRQLSAEIDGLRTGCWSDAAVFVAHVVRVRHCGNKTIGRFKHVARLVEIQYIIAHIRRQHSWSETCQTNLYCS